MSRLLFGAFAVMCFLLSGTANAALYSQLSTPFVKTTFFDPGLGRDVNAYVSQNDSILFDPVIGQVFDNFRLDADASVNKISWVGAYLLSSTGLVPTFEISFFTNPLPVSPDPGIVPPPSSLALSNVAVTETQIPGTGFEGYFLYTADIAPVAFLGGQTYWLSVMANVPVAEDWGWAITNANVSPALVGSVQDFGVDRFVYDRVDFAFSLDGTSSNVIPEPMSALVFVGLIGGMAIYRRKKAISANAS
jgi:hypothetical protein